MQLTREEITKIMERKLFKMGFNAEQVRKIIEEDKNVQES